MKGVLPKLVCWVCRAGTRDFCPALTDLVSPVQNIFYSPHTTLVHCICPQRSASLTGSRAGSPVSQYVSLVLPEAGRAEGG
jgi:hypothetical protein